MVEQENFLKVKGNKFWILEQKTEEEEEVKGREEYKVNAWVFDNERDAILKLKGLITEENVDFDKLDEIEKLGAKYNLQEVEIVKDKYNMKAVSWLKVALLSFSEK